MNIGDEYGGGIVFSVDETGNHGLIAAKEDMTGHSADNEEGRFTWSDAKAACHAFVGNGYRDWFLPNKEQLNQLYLHKRVVGGFADYSTYYWSSSESNTTNAWLQVFINGYQSHSNKGYVSRVRAVRAF
jgi:hypothetical protein